MPNPCHTCFGTGQLISSVGINSTLTICPDCEGQGVIMSEKKQLRRKLPPNASRGQQRLAVILDAIFRSNGVDMTVIYEQPLVKIVSDATHELADEYGVSNMAVDFYVKEMNMAIEFQGEQHYDDNHFYSGQATRDNRKRAFLRDIGVTLIEIPSSIGIDFTEQQIRKLLGLS